MTEEEKSKDIEKILNWLRTDGTIFTDDIDKIEKYIKQLEKKDKIIDKMTNYIDCSFLMIDTNANCKDMFCNKCLREYFEKKVEG